jgi:hypothetical protein
MTQKREIIQAETRLVKMGKDIVQGLMFPDKTFGMGVVEVCSLLNLNCRDSEKTIKELMPNIEFKWCTTNINNNLFPAITLDDFQELLNILLYTNNKAMEIMMLFILYGLRSLVLDVSNE